MNGKFNWWFISITLMLAVVVISAFGLSSYITDKVIARQNLEFSRMQVAFYDQSALSGKVAGAEVVATTVIIDQPSHNNVSASMNVNNGSTVLDALTQATSVYGLKLETKDDGTLGILVTAIGDQTNGQDNNYWSYYVNGTLATVAVNKQVIKHGDTVEFKYSSSPF